jgi:hypothetical protein
VLEALLGLGKAFASVVFRPRPKLHVSVEHTGGESAGVTFRAYAANDGLRPTHDVRVVARLGRTRDVVYTSHSFDLSADGKRVAVKPQIVLPSPGLADLIHACNNDPTLYGSALAVELEWKGKVRAHAAYREPDYDPVSDSGRYAAKLAHSREHGRV